MLQCPSPLVLRQVYHIFTSFIKASEMSVTVIKIKIKNWCFNFFLSLLVLIFLSRKSWPYKHALFFLNTLKHTCLPSCFSVCTYKPLHIHPCLSLIPAHAFMVMHHVLNYVLTFAFILFSCPLTYSGPICKPCFLLNSDLH